MKQLTCEMCGSTDLIKQDGVFVCQTCGCKYSIEEAKKMMVEGTVEVVGTVRIDESAKEQERINNYLKMAEAAFEGSDIEGTTNYCDKILEIDPSNCRAWILKAKIAGWGSTLGNMKIPQAITATKRAIDLSPDEKKYEVAEEIYCSIKNQIVALLNLAYKVPGSEAEYIHRVMLQWQESLVEIPYLSVEVIEREIQDCETLCRNSKNAIMPKARMVFAAYFAYNHFESYDKMFRNTLSKKLEQEKNRQEKIAEDQISKRREAYWADHTEEKVALEGEKEKLKKQIEIYSTEIDSIPGKEEQSAIQERIKHLENEIVSLSLGLFKGKEKKSLQEKIDAAKEELKTISDRMEAAAAEIQKKIDPLMARVAEIETELTKDR